MKRPLFRTIVAASLLVLAGAGQAAVMSPTVNAAGDFTAIDTTTGGATVEYRFNINPTTNPIPAVFYDTTVRSQSPDNIAALITAAYDVQPGLRLVNTCDQIGSSCAGHTSTATSLTLNSVQPFDYLAVAFGGGELFFHWAQPITSMTLTALNGFPGALGNYRAYLTTPVPGALALFLGAIGLLGVGRRLARRSSGEPANQPANQPAMA